MTRRSTPTPKQVRDHLAGLDALYRPATAKQAEDDRIIGEFKGGASVEALRAQFPHRDVDVILRRRVWPVDGKEGR